jgi:hypothetical protein
MTELLEGVILAVILLAVGFFAGRMTTRPVEGKQFDVGKMPVSDNDPYRDALLGSDEVIKDRE